MSPRMPLLPLSRSRSSQQGSSPSPPRTPGSVRIESRQAIYSVAFLPDGKHFVSGGTGKKIQRWRVESGKEVGTPMDAGSTIFDIAVSRDGKWIVTGSENGRVTVWNAETYKRMTEFQAHDQPVRAVDISPHASRIATGSRDRTACIWSNGGQRLLKLPHEGDVAAVIFSPDGESIATTTLWHDSVRIYDSRGGHLLIDFPLQLTSTSSQSLVWTSSGKSLYALSLDGNIYYLDVSTGTTLSRWPINTESRDHEKCIALASSGAFIAASAGSTISFWDTSTHNQIGSIADHTAAEVRSMAISTSNDIVIGGGNTITLRRNAQDFIRLPDPHDVKIQRPNARNGSVAPNRSSTHVLLTPRSMDNRILPSEEVVQEPSNLRYTPDQEDKDSSETIVFLRQKVANLEETITHLHSQLDESKRTATQNENRLGVAIESLHARAESLTRNVAHLGETVERLNNRLSESQRRADGLLQILRVHEQMHLCESLYAKGRVIDAANSLLEIKDSMSESVKLNNFVMDELSEFTHRCIERLERIGDKASDARKPDEAITVYATALTLDPSIPKTVLIKWASIMLIQTGIDTTLSESTKFRLSRFLVHQTICDILEEEDRITEAIVCFHHLQNEIPEGTSTHDERVRWETDFRRRCADKLERLGDNAVDSRNYDTAVKQYSDALTLVPTNQDDILLRRCRAWLAMSLWQEALVDADKVIEFDPLSHRGYVEKHAALNGLRRYSEAFEAFKTMLSRLEQSPDPSICELRGRFVDATPTIQKIIEQTIRPNPHVLIDITTGRLCDKTQQAAAFEALPIYDELRSSMTTQLDRPLIERKVKGFYQYVMLSHKWQPVEPDFKLVENISVYGLPATPTHCKLQRFCELVRSLRFRWAWSDTCCVNQLDNQVQQESLVAMFRWYRDSSLTIVHILGVLSNLQRSGDLRGSIWNTRAWTYQEYLAAKTVRFYTEDWKPYLGLGIFNHKESPIILLEMEQAMNFTTQQLATLKPGFDRAREKLYLASNRQAMREEDIAYSLFGIFDTTLPVMYGEGVQAIGRLLEHILTSSDNAMLLAWTGRSGSRHSYLPADLIAYSQIVPPHVPPLIEIAEMDNMVMAMQTSFPDPAQAITLYERLDGLPSLSVASGRLKLPGIVFPLPAPVPFSGANSEFGERVYRARAPMLGDIEIKTRDNLTGMEGLLLIHPWISLLLDEDFPHGATQYDHTTRALRLVIRLRQRFGALLLAPLARQKYKRIATQSLIMVQIREETPLTELIDSIRTIDVQ